MKTQAGIKKELQKREAYRPVPIILREDFPKQNAVVNDTSRYIAVQCSRRSGKSNSVALRFFKSMEKHPKSQCLYVSLTQDSAKGIMWPVLQDLNDLHKIGCKFVESKLMMYHPNGATLRLMGADLQNFIKRLKGRKHPGIAIDEAQDFGPHLQSLVNDVLIPSIADYSDGWIALTGTPGPVPQGYFFDITCNRKYGFSYHEWTALENPYMPNPAQFIEEQRIRNSWDFNHPTYLREWKNQWVLDKQALWVQYDEKTDHFDVLPQVKRGWNYIMGIDLGFKDADAIAVLAWSEDSDSTYLVEECINRKQGITELVGQIEALTKKYPVTKMVIDEGGLGKKIAEELRRQKSIPVEQADKAQKQQNVAFLNDALRLGRFKAKANSQFAQDSYLVQIDWEKSRPDKIVIKKHPHSDIIDAVLYAFKESPAYTYEPPVEKPKYGTRQWIRAEEDRMFQQELERMEREKQEQQEDWRLEFTKEYQ